MRAMASLHYQRPPRDITPKPYSSGHSLTRHELVFTMLALRVCPLHLHVNLGRETVFNDDLAILVLHTLVETSLVGRISLYINHQNQRPIGKVRLHFSVTITFLTIIKIHIHVVDLYNK